MATFSAISSITKAIVRLLESGFPVEELNGISISAVTGMEISEGLKETVSVFFNRYEINPSGRMLKQQSDSTTKKKPSLPLDLFYIITPWISNTDKQQRILGRLLQTINDNPILSQGFLNADMEKMTFDISEAVNIIFESVKLQDLSTISDIYKVRFPASIFLIAKQVMIESEMEIIEGEPVRTRSFEMGLVK